VNDLPNSIRERIIQAVLANLQLIAQANDVGLHRSPTVALTRKQSPALVVFPEEEEVEPPKNLTVDRHLMIRVVALAREMGPNAGEVVADQLITAAHGALMANRNLDGLCLSIKELGTLWDIEDADATAVEIQVRYQIDYRTPLNDLTK
jgi:hypothetical protein